MKRALLLLLNCLFMIGANAKIYDCFPFFNELELLEIRLNELYDHVDKFVLVESTNTFRGNSKPLYFEENKDHFEKFSDKIIHIIITDNIDTIDPWVRENFQRQQILKGLSECAPEDVILISDMDEIVRATSLPHIIRAIQQEKKEIVGCSQTLYRFYLNVRDPVDWFGTFATTYNYLIKNNIDLSEARLNHKSSNLYPIIENAGWHFTWMGGHKRVVLKLESYSHQEHDRPENKTKSFISDEMAKYNCKIEHVDASYPHYIQDHINDFKNIKWTHE